MGFFRVPIPSPDAGRAKCRFTGSFGRISSRSACHRCVSFDSCDGAGGIGVSNRICSPLRAGACAHSDPSPFLPVLSQVVLAGRRKGRHVERQVLDGCVFWDQLCIPGVCRK